MILELLDPGSFVEHGSRRRYPAPNASHTITGSGEINARKVFVIYHADPILRADSAERMCKLLDLAADTGAPLIGLYGGSEAANGIAALGAFGEVLDRHVRYSGVIPQLSVVTGRSVGAINQRLALSDLVIAIAGTSQMYVSRPSAIKQITAEVVDDEDLGGATAHATRSGVVDLVADDLGGALELIRYTLSFLPDNNLTAPPYFNPTDDPDRVCSRLETILPAAAHHAYDMLEVVGEIVDDGEVLTLGEHWAPNIVTAFARLDGHVVGLVASQPRVLAGTLDIDASVKGARFVRFCDAFNIPLLAILDVPGFRPGIEEEYGGIIRHGAKLVYAFAEATVPRVTLIARKAYGGAYIVMNSRHIRADLSFAWPTAEIAVMGAEGAARIIHRRDIASADDPAKRASELIEEYRTRLSNPYLAAERGFVDDVITPAETRARLIAAFEMLRGKREVLPDRKHGNIPL